jgi:3'-phosphoadenosine 5'-phosphosulfate sulfotransferase (PAPS reductase)/FAD synthetase
VKYIGSKSKISKYIVPIIQKYNEIDYEQRKKDLVYLQSESLSMKIQGTMAKIMEFYNRTDGNCYLSCSGGADSIVLRDIVQRFLGDYPQYKNLKTVFDDTGLEEPSVRAMALNIPNICVVRPEMPFIKVLTEIGYPLISKEVSECIDQARRYLENNNRDRYIYRLEKLLGTAKQKDGSKSLYNKEKYKPLINAPFRISNQCCNIMKKKPMGKLKEHPIIATMAEESENRKTAWYKSGCNSFEGKIASRPMSPWTKQDTMEYIKRFDVKIAECYGQVIPVSKDNIQVFEGCEDHYRFSGAQRTGCIFCMFGAHLDTLKNGTSRFMLLKQSQPKLFDYCMRGGKFDEQGLWIPDKGLGMAFVIEWCNRNLSKILKDGSKSLFYKGIDLNDYKEQIDNAFNELNKIEGTRKKWLTK